MAQTDYLVLQWSQAGHWKTDSRLWRASGAHQAVRLAAEAAASDGEVIAEGRFVAVPARSWSPLDVHWEDVPRVKVREAKAGAAAPAQETAAAVA